ncbi:MAG: glycosyltransferase [Phycisphaerales bacterium]|nr:glycosyltransferase [Phycisphaerales bacterium]
MRILIATIGSAGDVHPFLGVAEELRRRGHDVAMLVNPHFEARVRAVGIEFLPLGTEDDLLRVLHSPRLANQRQSPYLVIEELFNNSIEPSYAAMQDAVKSFKPDAILRHHIFPTARWVGEEHRIPVYTATLAPAMWFTPSEPMIFRSHVPIWFQKAANKPLKTLGKHLMRWYVDRPVNAVRSKLGLPSLRDVLYTESHAGRRVLGLWSRHYRGPLSDDPANSIICGYCFFDRARGEQDLALDPALDRFLSKAEERGRPAIVFTLGTTIVHHARDFYDTAVAACRALDRPCVLLTGKDQAAPLAARGADDVCVVNYAPHSLVMPRCAASVHHAGAGSASQSMRSGKPSVAVPFVNDEFDIAHRMENLGVSAYLPSSKLLQHRAAVTRLASALSEVTQTPSFAIKARQLGQAIGVEHGAASAAAAIESGLETTP